MKTPTFELEMWCGGSAFSDRTTEIARLLRLVADRVEEGDSEGLLLDLNGNTCGSFAIDGEDR